MCNNLEEMRKREGAFILKLSAGHRMTPTAVQEVLETTQHEGFIEMCNLFVS